MNGEAVTSERNTFATSAYIEADPSRVYEYLCDLRNLNEWTLFSRMTEQVDDRTWLGTASGYQQPLYYHLRSNDRGRFKSIEWHCGLEYNKYFQVYPVILLPPTYFDPSSDETGVYFHWVSFVDPARRVPMIEQGIGAVHTAECRSLKGILEARAGRREVARGRQSLASETLFIDASRERGLEWLSDPRIVARWCFLLRPQGDCGPEQGEFVDEYGHKVVLSTRVHAGAELDLVEHESVYPELGFIQRTVTLLVPCSYAFGVPGARGFIKHRIAAWPERPRHGKLQIEEFQAESINFKRMIEASEGNMGSFARGMSYSSEQGTS